MRRPMVFVLLAGLAAMLASVMVYSALKRREAEVQNAMSHNVEVVVAAMDLPLGTKIEPGEVKLARWSADSLPDGAYTDSKQVLGSYVKNSLVANEPIVQTKLFTGDKTAGVMPLLIPFGMRAVSVPVDEVSDVAGFVPRSANGASDPVQQSARGFFAHRGGEIRWLCGDDILRQDARDVLG